MRFRGMWPLQCTQLTFYSCLNRHPALKYMLEWEFMLVHGSNPEAMRFRNQTRNTVGVDATSTLNPRLGDRCS